MDDVIEKVTEVVTEYGVEASALSIRLAIETFKDIRHYPSSWDNERVKKDMLNNIAKISMAAVEIDSKEGVENQTASSENGVSRTYYKGLMAYKEVVSYGVAI